jgi:hypothetical protein
MWRLIMAQDPADERESAFTWKKTYIQQRLSNLWQAPTSILQGRAPVRVMAIWWVVRVCEREITWGVNNKKKMKKINKLYHHLKYFSSQPDLGLHCSFCLKKKTKICNILLLEYYLQVLERNLSENNISDGVICPSLQIRVFDHWTTTTYF